MLKDIVKIFYKSDFTIQWELPVGYEGQDFRFTLFTNDDIEDGWTASYIDGTYTHCLVEDDRVTIYVDADHDMKAGCLTVQSEYDLGNNHFADGTETIKDRVKTNIYLVSIGANGTSATFIASNRADLTGSGDFVTFSDLDAMSYITSNELSQMSYVTISDLDDYLTQEEIEDMGFLTQAQLSAMGYATTDYIDSKDYATSAQVAMKQNLLVSGRNIKTVNGYSLLGQGNITIESGSEGEYNVIEEIEVNGEAQPIDNKTVNIIVPTKVSDLNNDTGFITESALGEMVTYSYLETAIGDFVTSEDLVDDGYVTDTDVQTMMTNAGYVTSNELSQMGYITNSTLAQASYVTQQGLSAMGYITASQVPTPDMSAYVTKTELSNAGYVTSNDLSGFVTDTELSNVLSTASYVTQNELSNAGYITNSTLSQASYVTQQGLSGMGYATTSQLNAKQDTLVSGTNIKTVNGSSLLGSGDLTITGGSTITEVTQAEYDAMEQAGTLDPDTLYIISDAQSADLDDYVTKTELSNAGYLTSVPSEYITETELSNVLSTASYVTSNELSNAGYITNSTLSQASYVTQQGLSGMSYATTSDLTSKQDTLVSGTNIKTINNESILGTGNITITGGGGSEPDYSNVLTFTNNNGAFSSTIKIIKNGTQTDFNDLVLQYSTDGGETWNNYTLNTVINLSTSTASVKFKGINEYTAWNDYNYHQFVMTGRIGSSGDLTSLLNEVGGDMPLTKSYTFNHLFENCTALASAPKLPSTTLSASCYYKLFYGCTALVTAPMLPATTLKQYCYNDMFYGCTSLKNAPELPAKTAMGYFEMFRGCTALTKAPDLPATTLTSDCYNKMFYGCTALKDVPEILPATTLTNYCYQDMFYNCRALTKAPVLPATTLVSDCYKQMFYGCTNLKYVKAMFTTTPSNSYTQNWLYNVSSTGTFVKSSSATWTSGGESAAPLNWTKYKAISIDTDDMPESYVEDEGMTLQVVSGAWTKVAASGGSGDVNVIESVSVNGTALVPDANKNVDVTVPTTTSQLTNNSGFLTSANFIYDSTTNTLTISI